MITTSSRTNLVDKYIGNRLRQGRLERGMSASDIADALGVTLMQVIAFEKGLERIPPFRLIDLSKFFKVPVHFFFDSMHAETCEVSNETRLDVRGY